MKHYKDSRAIYPCQAFGIAFGTIIMALFNHRVIGFVQFVWGAVIGWFLGLGCYLLLLEIYPRENDCARCNAETIDR